MQISTHTFSGNYQNGSVFGYINFTYDFYVLHPLGQTILNYDVFPYSVIIDGYTIISNDPNSFSQVGQTQTTSINNFGVILQTFPQDLALLFASNIGCQSLGGSNYMTKITKTYKFNAPQYLYENIPFQTTTYFNLDSTDLNLPLCPQLFKVNVKCWIEEINVIDAVGVCVELAQPTYGSDGRLIGESTYYGQKFGYAITTQDFSASPPCSAQP